MVWAAENPNEGLVESDGMDHVRCLDIQRPYLGQIECHYTDWTPLQNRINSFAEDRDDVDPSGSSPTSWWFDRRLSTGAPSARFPCLVVGLRFLLG